MSTADQPWSERRERKLLAKVQQRLPAGETARHVAIVFEGAGPTLGGMVVDVALQDWTLGLVRSRHYFTVAVTDRRVLLIKNIGETTPDTLEGEWHLAEAFGEMSEVDGDNWVEIGRRRCWYWPNWKAPLRAARAAAMTAEPAT